MSCDISWKSPLLKGLQDLRIIEPSAEARPRLGDWLDALNEMPQLETLHLESATPLASQIASLLPKPSRTVTLPSLTRFHINASAEDCALAFAHLVLPTLTRLHVEAESLELEGEDVQLLVPYVTRNVYGLQSSEPLRSILMSGYRKRAEVIAWTMPDADAVCSSVSACLMFAATGGGWPNGVNNAIVDALLTRLPVDSVSTLTAQNYTRLSTGKEFWLSHAPRWPLLERASLIPATVKAFRDILAEGAPPDGPRLPSLTKLILVDVTLTAVRTYHLRDMLMKRVEQGVPLEVLDLQKCVAADRAIQLLKEIVVDVQVPLDSQSMMEQAMKEEPAWNWYGGIEYCNEVEYDDYEDEDEAEYGDEYVYDDYHGLDYDDDVQLNRSAPIYDPDYEL